jgi:hypothetical protein
MGDDTPFYRGAPSNLFRIPFLLTAMVRRRENGMTELQKNCEARHKKLSEIRCQAARVSIMTNPAPMTHTDEECNEAIDVLARLYAEEIVLLRERVSIRHTSD